MIRFLMLTALSFAAVVPLTSAQSSTSAADERAVIEAQERWRTASAELDMKAADQLLAAEFESIQNVGVILSRANLLKSFEAIAANPQFKANWEKVSAASAPERRQVRIYDNVAIVTQRLRYPEPRGSVQTYVWVKRNGAWRLALSQGTPTAERPSSAKPAPGAKP